MRSDAIGMFWEDLPVERGKNKIARVMPEIPDTGWVPPTEFPNLSRAAAIAIDLETYDPDLKEKGPGWARGAGHIVGVAIGADGGGRWYFPMRHEVEPEYNCDPEVILKWLRDVLSNPNQPKIGANIQYDIGWLREEGVFVKGEFFDVQFAEALLDETSAVALEVLGQKYLDEGKESNLLYQWCADYYGGNPTPAQRKNLYRTPPRLAGPYALSDVDLPLRIISKQWPLLIKERLLDLFMMECQLIPLMIEMRFQGVTVNLSYAEELCEKLRNREAEFQDQLDKTVGFGVNVNAPKSLQKAFDSQGVSYPRTKKGNPSFVKAFLDGLDHPLGNLIREIRTHNKLRSTFVESYILNSHVNGKVYGQFHQLRGDEKGTRSGRFSSSNPNLQNIPSRDPILAPLIRGLFIPDYNHQFWRKYDYSQIEYRFLVHFAIGKAGDNARRMFNENPDMDYHTFAQGLVKEMTGVHIDRKPIKNLNFGLIYGMGLKTMGIQLGFTKQKTKEIFKAYFDAVPFAKDTMGDATDEAQKTGIISTILGRKSRFNQWEPRQWGNKSIPLPIEKAILAYGDIQRSGTHKALNRKLQGSSADQLKMAMLQCWKDGVYDDIGVPRLTVHDELNHSDPGGKDEGFKEMKRIMETCVQLSIPVKVDGEIGPDWGHLKDLPA